MSNIDVDQPPAILGSVSIKSGTKLNPRKRKRVDEGLESTAPKQPRKRRKVQDPQVPGTDDMDIEDPIGEEDPMDVVDAQVASIGVMDVGMGSCSVLFDAIGNPLAYYDIGSPLGFYKSSIPQSLFTWGLNNWPNDGTGPIVPPAPPRIPVIISHWDWDHWSLLRRLPADSFQILHRNVHLTASARNYLNAAGNDRVVNANVQVPGLANAHIHLTNPGQGLAAPAVKNNTGLAVRVVMQTPAPPAGQQPVNNAVLMTGDANFNTVHGFGALQGIATIVAPHHGSRAHGAYMNLPQPVVPEGRIAYSYGIRAYQTNPAPPPFVDHANPTHCYGFPRREAVAGHPAGAAPRVPGFRGSRWIDERATAEHRLQTVPPRAGNAATMAQRGNICIGPIPPRPAAFHGSPFYVFPARQQLH